MTVYDVRRFVAVVSFGAFLAGCAHDAATRDGAGEAVPGEGASFTGDVVEMLPAGRYTYYRLRVAEGDERWVVVSDKEHRDASRLSVRSNSVRRDFASSRLGRSFAVLHFSSIETSTPPGAP